MGLVTSKEVAKAINLAKYGVFGTFIGWVLLSRLTSAANAASNGEGGWLFCLLVGDAFVIG